MDPMAPCSCGLLPCICVGDEPAEDPRASLRRLLAADASAACASCMMLPCICPPEPLEDEATSVEAATPPAEPQAADSDEEQEEVDAFGRARLVDGEELWVARELKRVLKPHQKQGVRFLLDNVRAQRGCILADYMGLGKTLQVIAAVHSFMIDQLQAREESGEGEDGGDKAGVRPPVTPTTAMVLCPAICIPNWEAEFKKWLSTESLEQCPVLALDSTTGKGTTAGRIRLLQKWRRQGGVLLIGYEMFRSLLNPTLAGALDREPAIQVCTRVGSSTMEVTDSLSAKTQKSAREFYQFLCNPGADLVVLDEGHRMKDPSSLLCQSVAKIKSHRRLVLTGYPVQNSLSEYWCMVNFARDNFLGSYESFRSSYEKPIMEGNAARSKELIDKLQDVVLRRGKALLRKQLPPKMEWILYCKLSPIQHRLYCDFLDFYGESEDGKANADLLTAYAALLQVMNHPDIIYSKLCPDERDAEVDEDPDQLALGGRIDEWAWESEERLMEKKQLAAAQLRKRRQKITDRQKSYEWARSVIFGQTHHRPSRPLSTQGSTQSIAEQAATIYRTEVLENSGKMAVLMQIIEESFACGDKVVVFSQSVPTLKVIGDFLRTSHFNPSREADLERKAKAEAAAATGKKVKRRRILHHPKRDPAGIIRKRNVETGTKRRKLVATTDVQPETWFLQIDGSTSGAKRMEYIDLFSSASSSVKLLLVSTRAGAEGINLHAANRLVLFDVSWNPSNDHQSMCRSHRIGQSKTVHVYRLVSTGTMERMIYEQQMKKVDLSTAVVDNKQKDSSVAAPSSAAGSTSTDAVPFSGFLQAPAPPDASQLVKLDESDVQGDEVLVSCMQNLGHWLVDVHPVHEPQEDSSKPILDE